MALCASWMAPIPTAAGTSGFSLKCPVDRGCSHVVIATFEPLCGKETVEVLGWQKHVFAVCG